MAETTVSRNDEESRYEIHVDGVLAGHMGIAESEGKILIPHTRVFDEFGGQGLAGILVGQALSDLAGSDRPIVPLCPYVEKYLRSRDVPGVVVEWPDRGED